MRILITGANGQLSSELVALIKDFSEVFSFTYIKTYRN